MARTTGSDGARTEEAIRLAAIDLIAARGFEAMTLRELADKVGLQAGSIYRYFPSKAQLLVVLLVEHLDFLLAHWQQQRPVDTDPVVQLRAFVDFHIRSHTLRRREAFVANMELRSLAADDYRRVVALRKRYEQQLTQILAAGCESGAFRLPDARVATFAILALLTGVGTWYREAGHLKQRDLVALYTTLVMQCVGRSADGRLPRRSASRVTPKKPRHAPGVALESH